MKDLSYLKAFSPKVLREVKRILHKGFTVEDIDEFLGKQVRSKPSRRLSKELMKEALKDVKWGRQPCKSCDEKRKQKEL